MGLTGGIASGKSALSAALERLGVPVIDTDRLAHEVIEPGRPAYDEILARFGRDIVGDDGRIDRKALGRIVFADPVARQDLEGLTHSRVMQAVDEQFSAFAAEGVPVAVCEVPLLAEAGLVSFFDRVVVVAAHLERQRSRMAARDGLSREEAQARIDAQMPTEEKVALADEVIWNDGTLDDLQREVGALHERLLVLAEGGSA